MPLRIVADSAFGSPPRHADLLTKQFPVVNGDGHHGGVGSLRAGNGLDDGTKTPAVGRQSPDRDGAWPHDDGRHGRSGVGPRSVCRQHTRLARRGFDRPRRKKGRQSITTGITASRGTATRDKSAEPRLHFDLFRGEAGKPYDSASGIVDPDKQGSGETDLAVDHEGIGRPLQTTGPHTAAGNRHEHSPHRGCRTGRIAPQPPQADHLRSLDGDRLLVEHHGDRVGRHSRDGTLHELVVLVSADDDEVFVRAFGNRPLPRSRRIDGGGLRQPRDRPHAAGRQFDPALWPHQYRRLFPLPREVISGKRRTVDQREHELGTTFGAGGRSGGPSHRPHPLAGHGERAAGAIGQMHARGIDPLESAGCHGAVALLHRHEQRALWRRVCGVDHTRNRPDEGPRNSGHDSPDDGAGDERDPHYRFSSPEASRLKYCSIASR